MHYIRLLRPPRLDASPPDPRRPSPPPPLIVSLLLTITTDLGDSFLHPDEPVPLAVSATDPAGQSVLSPLDAAGQSPPPLPRWAAGMRLLDVRVPLRPRLRRKGDVTCTIEVYPATQGPALKSSDVLLLPWAADTTTTTSTSTTTASAGRTGGSPAREGRGGLIMPVSVEMAQGVCSPLAVRTLRMVGGPATPGPGDLSFTLDLEEDIGESIARHIWDAGVVTACFLADAWRAGTGQGIRDALPARKDGLNVLELGSGVGILGLTLARVVEGAAIRDGDVPGKAVVLLTDLPEAEERARSNIARAEAAISRGRAGDSRVAIQYENLDWDEGRHGRFGPLASARPWDLVVLSDCTYNVDSLPALVGTLSALHAATVERARAEKGAEMKVILATKPRHSSEQALFGLLADDGWRYSVLKSIPLPKLGEEDEVVDVYLLEKGRGPA